MKNKTMLEEIIEHCTKNGITAYKLAQHLPLSQVALQGILDQKTKNPRLKNIQQIHDYLFKKETPSSGTLESTNQTGYDLKIESIIKEMEEIKSNVKLIEEEMPKMNHETSQKFYIKLKDYKTKLEILSERIEIMMLAKNNHELEK